MRRNVDLYFMALKNSFASRMAYRADFLFSLIMILITELIIPFITLLIYRTGAVFPGWTLYEVLMLQGIFLLARGLSNLLFFGMVWNTLDRVREGTYDILLIKPCSTLFISIATCFEPDSIGAVIGGIVVCAYAMSGVAIPSPAAALMSVLLFLLSMIMLFSLALFMAGSVFKWVGNSRIYEIFDSIAAFGNYPRSIFTKAFQTLISYVVPIATIGFLPASVLLGKKTEGIPVTICICLLFLIAGALFWKSMLKKYTSAGG
jgi:ABC-2 type transport system permease protein